jgi:TPR repeat protein
LGGAGVGRDGLARLYEQGLGVREDFFQAYMWFRLADNESAVAELRSKMTETQILEAERITQEWKSRHPEPKEFLNGKGAEIGVQP